MYIPKEYIFTIPVRPKAVQSTRFAQGHTFVDRKTKKWKACAEACMEPWKPEVPSKLPFEVFKAIYQFKWPATMTKKAKAAIKEAQDRGEDIPYLNTPDLSDNINKGVADTITKMGFWEDDKQLWRVAKDAEIRKVYGDTDSITIGIRETPYVMTVKGKTAYELVFGTKPEDVSASAD